MATGLINSAIKMHPISSQMEIPPLRPNYDPDINGKCTTRTKFNHDIMTFTCH